MKLWLLAIVVFTAGCTAVIWSNDVRLTVEETQGLIVTKTTDDIDVNADIETDVERK